MTFSENWVNLIYNKYLANSLESQISREEIATAVLNIVLGRYRLSPLFNIVFQPGVIGPENSFRGVPVFPILSAHPAVVALGKPLEKQAFYMNPLDELVLSTLGELLLQRHYPEYLEDPDYVATLNLDLFEQESRENVAKAIAGLVGTDAFLNKNVGLLTYQFVLSPFHYYLDGTETKIDNIPGEFTHEFFDAAPAHYYSPYIYKVRNFFDYIALLKNCCFSQFSKVQ